MMLHYLNTIKIGYNLMNILTNIHHIGELKSLHFLNELIVEIKIKMRTKFTVPIYTCTCTYLFKYILVDFFFHM